MWYGEPLRTTRAFRSSHSDQSIKDAEMSHAIRAVKKILDSISDTNASTSDQPTIVTGKAHVIGFCSSIILDATREDFFQESQSSSSTTTDSSDESHSDQAASVRKKKTEEKRRRRRKEQETRHKKRKQKKRKRKKEGRKIEETDEEDKHTDGSGSGSGSGSDDEDEGRITEKIKSINIKSNHRHKIIFPTSEADGDDEGEDDSNRFPRADQPCTSQDAYPPSGDVVGVKRKLDAKTDESEDSKENEENQFRFPFKMKTPKQKKDEKRQAVKEARYFLDNDTM